MVVGLQCIKSTKQLDAISGRGWTKARQRTDPRLTGESRDRPTPLTFSPATVQTEPKYEFKQALTFREQLGTFDVEYIGVRLNQMIDYIYVVA